MYNIQSGEVTYKFVLLYNGGILIDGQHPQSIIYKQGVSSFFFFLRIFSSSQV